MFFAGMKNCFQLMAITLIWFGAKVQEAGRSNGARAANAAHNAPHGIHLDL
jgi:hypothetical protein